MTAATARCFRPGDTTILSGRRSEHHNLHISAKYFYEEDLQSQAMMKLLLPFALFFVMAVEGNLRGDLSHDDKRRRLMGSCMMSKFDSWSLLLSIPFR
jgi:hypothetical protein